MVGAFICYSVMSSTILNLLGEQTMTLIIAYDLYIRVTFNYYKLPLQLKNTGV